MVMDNEITANPPGSGQAYTNEKISGEQLPDMEASKNEKAAVPTVPQANVDANKSEEKIDAILEHDENQGQHAETTDTVNGLVPATDPITTEQLKEWFKMTRNSLTEYKSSIKRVEEAQAITNVDFRAEINGLIWDLKNRQSTFETAKEFILARLRSTTNDPEMLRDLELPPEPTRRFSSGKTSFLPWRHFLDCESMPPTMHDALEIPSSEPTAGDLNGRETKVDQELASIIAAKAEGSQIGPEKLPERIKLTSLRLVRLLDFELNDGSLHCTTSGPLTILRPFKILLYQDKRIRNRLSDFEQARRRSKDLTEDEYLEEFKRDPFPDEETHHLRDESEMSLSELTGFINDWRCLTKFMDVLESEQARIAQIPETIRFADLWFLFSQGSLIYCKDNNVPQKIWRIVQRTGGRRYLARPESIPDGQYRTVFSPFVVDCYHLDHDGTRYVPTFRQFRFTDFEGTQPVKSLHVLPLLVAERDLNLVDRAELLERGRQFADFTRKPEHHHRYYSGRSYYRTPEGIKLGDLEDGEGKATSKYSERIDSEVIIDFRRAIQEIPWWRPGNEPKFHKLDVAETLWNDSVSAVDSDEKWDSKLTDDFLDAETRKWRHWETFGLGPEEEDDLMLLPERVFAFVLRTRRWSCLRIGKDTDGKESITMLKPRQEPWNNLELPTGHKELVQSLLQSHFDADKLKSLHFDLVKDKGKGVIILLHGVPGVGKTSTAECAAESSGRPLLPITCGDLGLTPGEVETKLQEMFRLAQAWNCILLLDESDIFLAQRTVTDMGRNALVSVFLRILEYYEGVLFLTTNRVGVFDEAFKSRIHMSLYYPPLERWQTNRIWQSHIKKALGAGIQANEAELMAFAEQTFDLQSKPGSGPVWNGRQIRNAFQSAVALAGFHSKSNEIINLSAAYFQNVFEVSDKFSNYIWKTKQGQTDADFNKMLMTRRDDFVYVPVSINAAHMASPMPQQHASFGNFPQSTFGLSMQRPSTPFGMQGQQQMGAGFGQLSPQTQFGTQQFNQAFGVQQLQPPQFGQQQLYTPQFQQQQSLPQTQQTQHFQPQQAQAQHLQPQQPQPQQQQTQQPQLQSPQPQQPQTEPQPQVSQSQYGSQTQQPQPQGLSNQYNSQTHYSMPQQFSYLQNAQLQQQPSIGGLGNQQPQTTHTSPSATQQ